MLRLRVYLIFIIVMYAGMVSAQCPVNIGFDNGDFTNWVGNTGMINSDGSITMTATGIVPGRQTLFKRSAQQYDPYGNFLIASPNGSSTCVRLGSTTTGKQAENLTYTFTVPANVKNYSLIYYYAVVFQNPNHLPYQQPSFTANVFDVGANKYATCGSFTFVASSNLPGFQQSPNGASVFYKDWSAVTIDLSSYAGKTLRLEFTANDCSLGGHFGYAYLDVNQNCTSPVSGNVICANNPGITLTAPAGFEQYYWYKGTDFSTIISQSPTYSINPAPPVGSTYSVRIVPYPGIGCEDTITTTIQAVENLKLNVVPAVAFCQFQPVDITKPAITAGSDSTFTYTYYTDAAATNFIPDPTNITDSGTYYIEATSQSGCFYIKPIKISFLPTPNLKITNPTEACQPALVDITAPAVTAGSTNAGNLTYWTDAAATIPLTNPKTISVSGTYYIKSVNSIGCYDISPVNVLIDNLPILMTNNTFGCNTADITAPNVTLGSSGGTIYTYYTDAAATKILPTPKAVTQSGVYYIKLSNSAGCSVTKAVTVTIYPYPQITVTNPTAVIFPQTVDITRTFIPQAGSFYYYYSDSLATNLVTYPDKVTKQGTYYIKAVNGNDCSVLFPVLVTVKAPPAIDFSVNTFTPNGDGVNDIFHIKIPDAVQLNSFTIYGSWGGIIFQSTDPNKGWDGTMGGNGGSKLPVGTYYWIFDAYDSYNKVPIKQSGSITIVL